MSFGLNSFSGGVDRFAQLFVEMLWFLAAVHHQLGKTTKSDTSAHLAWNSPPKSMRHILLGLPRPSSPLRLR